jgi:hypothetical protein
LLSAIAETTHVLKPGIAAPVLYQPAFRAGDLTVVVDILRPRRKQFDLVEVKASTEAKDEYLPDLAFQALVLKRAKIPLDRIHLGLVNKEFTLRRPGDYDGLLKEEDVTDRVEGFMPDATVQAAACLGVLSMPVAPVVAVGNQCRTPHACPFADRCHAPRVGYPVEELPRGGTVVDALLRDGFTDLAAVPAERLEKPVHRRVRAAVVSGQALFDAHETAELRALHGPYAYLDFETINSPVPEIVGTRPYEQIPFQWSLHVERSPDDVSHSQYLAIEDFGDFDAMASALTAAVPTAGPIFAYNASFEMQVLLRLADLAPDFAGPLRDMAARLFDLLPVARAAYYHRDMRGSWSIKSLMPTIDPALGYEHLDHVRAGDGAQRAFLALRRDELSPEKALALRQSLLAYCGHDTWVMVVLRRFLCGETPVH